MNIEETKNENCKGCLAFDNIDGRCSLGIIHTDKCPCHNCLIKVMCTENCDVMIHMTYGDPNVLRN